MGYYKSLVDALWADYSQSFARAKKKLTGQEYHHIVAKGAYKATEARKVLNNVGIDVNDSRNRIWLKKRLHKRLHTNMYYKVVNEMVVKCYNMSNKYQEETAGQLFCRWINREKCSNTKHIWT